MLLPQEAHLGAEGTEQARATGGLGRVGHGVSLPRGTDGPGPPSTGGHDCVDLRDVRRLPVHWERDREPSVGGGGSRGARGAQACPRRGE
ncbi:hypothetical protein GCM10009815_41900 [Nocardioides marmoribigeumensis]